MAAVLTVDWPGNITEESRIVQRVIHTSSPIFLLEVQSRFSMSTFLIFICFQIITSRCFVAKPPHFISSKQATSKQWKAQALIPEPSLRLDGVIARAVADFIGCGIRRAHHLHSDAAELRERRMLRRVIIQ